MNHEFFKILDWWVQAIKHTQVQAADTLKFDQKSRFFVTGLVFVADKFLYHIDMSRQPIKKFSPKHS